MSTRHSDERTWLKGLAVECPLGKAVPSCPMNGMRNLPTIQIRHIVGQMTDEQVSDAIHSHRHCLEARLKEGRKPHPPPDAKRPYINMATAERHRHR